VAVIPVSEAQEAAALALIRTLRASGVVAEIAYKGNLKRRMERANKLSARAALILGETEVADGVVQLRDLDAGTQESVAVAEAVRRLSA
jgi:histidyl-tRNA synthetase